jgi:prepilin-type N-terminal cleavage/methylation domain-containing protein
VKKLQKGFTLIELMIVIAIIAILAAILIPNFLHARAESQTAACEGNEKQLATALEEYAVDNSGTYPASIAALAAVGPGTYLQVAPVDPAGGVYTLAVPAVAPCANTAANSYVITDGNLHDTTTMTSMIGYAAGDKGITYCSGSGLQAVP